MQINTKLLPGKQGTVTAEPPIKNGLLRWQSPWNIVLNDQLRCGHKGQKLRKTTVATRIWGGHTRNTHLRQGKEFLRLVVNRIFSCAMDNGIAHPTMCGFPFPDEINCSYLSLYLLGKVNYIIQIVRFWVAMPSPDWGQRKSSQHLTCRTQQLYQSLSFLKGTG